MNLKKEVNGKWVSIGPSTGGSTNISSGKAIDVSISDISDSYDTDNVEGALAEIGHKIKDVNTKVDKINTTFADHLENHPSGGDGPGGGVLPTIKSSFEISTSDGKTDIVIPIFFTSPNLGEGTCYILVNNIEVKTQQVQQGNNDIIVPAIGAGTNIPISIYVKDRAGMISNQITWTVTAGGIEIKLNTKTTSDFSIKNLASLSFAYTISCVSKEDIYAHLIIKGYDRTNNKDVDETIPIKSIVGYNAYPLKNLGIGVGVYHIEYWAESGPYATEHYKTSLVIVDDQTLLLSSDFDTTKEYESGVPITVPYRVSIDSNSYFTVDLYVDNIKQKTISTKRAYLYWSITSLDAGSHTLKIHAYNTELSVSEELELPCVVAQGDYARIQPVVDASLLCWFDATDKTNDDMNRDVWVDKVCGNIGRLYNFNYSNNGWLKSSENSAFSELKMDGTAYVEIDMTPFKDNFTEGATIELVFKTRDVGDMYARVLDITDTLSPYKGVYVDTREAYLSTASQTFYGTIGNDEYIHVMFQIDREEKFAHIIINGVITKSVILSDSGAGTTAFLESIAHAQKIYLNSKKGTEAYGSCEIKHLRIYDRTLSYLEILQNYLSTIEDVTTQKAKADFNDASKKIMPVMNITVPEEELKRISSTDKIDVAMTYTSPNSDLYGETLTTATKCKLWYQGTSSISYNVKNYNIELRDENGQLIEYSPYPNCIPQSLFCLKANLMESTNAHNVGLADFVRRYLYTKNNPAMDIDPRTSRTVQGFPMLLYINGNFEGLYDFNLDRYSTKAFGYEMPQHKNCKVYEISANTNFTAGAFIPWSSDTGVDEWTWFKNDFKGIYPEAIQNPTNDDFAELKELINFVYHSSDEVFRTNFSTYFDKESVLRYYLFVMVMGLVDSLGKNAKLVTYDGVKWFFEFYDMDTAMGLNNSGGLDKDVDIEMEIKHFNTAESVLWKRIRDQFAEDLNTEYYNMRGTTLNTKNLYECLFTYQIEKIPEHQYNLSTKAKYLSNKGEYIGMHNGNRYYGMKRWIEERLLFCDTLFDYTPTTENFIQLRSSILGEISFEVETYSPMWFKIKWRNDSDNSSMEKKKIKRGEKITFTGINATSDQEIILYCSEHIKRISGMDNLSPARLFLNNASRLIELECPNCKELNELQIGNCSYLQRINFNGCESLGTLNAESVINVEGCSNLKYLDIRGTALTSVTTNQYGGNLVEIYYPNTIQTISLQNQYSLRTVGIPCAESLEQSKVNGLKEYAPPKLADFTLVNCPLVERLSCDDNFTASSSTIFFDNFCNERRGSELNTVTYTKGEWKRLMKWGNGLANCNTIYIENSCHNIPSMSFRGTTNLSKLSLVNMPYLKVLMLGANCCGYRTNEEPTYYANKYDSIGEFDWNEGFVIDNCPAIEEFRIHEMYPNNYYDGQSGNLTYFTFKPGTESIDLHEKFGVPDKDNPGQKKCNLKIFECNCATQNIHQIVLPKSLKSIITCAWNERHDEGFKNEVKLEQFNIDSIYFKDDHDIDYLGIDLGGYALENTRIVAPYAKTIEGVNITNTYVNPVFNDFKEPDSIDRPFATPRGTIDVSKFTWKEVSDWFAYIDFTQNECEIKVPTNWDNFLPRVTRAKRMFYHCKNPDFTWEFAMKFFPKMNIYTDLDYMYQHAQLAEQQDFDTDGVEMTNTYNIGGYNYNSRPFFGSNLKYVKSFTLSGNNSSSGAYGIFYDCTSLIKVGDCNFLGSKKSDWGINNLFYGCKNLEEVGVITSYYNASHSDTIPMNSTFEGCENLLSVGGFDINASSMDCTFSGCKRLTNEGLKFPNTKKVDDMDGTFMYCNALTNVEVPDMSNVVYANSIFYGCAELENVKLNGIQEFSSLVELSYAFYQCFKLKKVEIQGYTLPNSLRNMAYTFAYCDKLESLPRIPNFEQETTMVGCCSYCNSLTDDTIYKEIPFRVTNVNNLYANCNGLLTPTVDINTDQVSINEMFKKCENMIKLTVNCNGRLLLSSIRFAESCTKLNEVHFKFPSSFDNSNNYYATGVTYYRMFKSCPNLEKVYLNMKSLADTNTKADLGEMFIEDNYIKEIHGLDLTYLKKPVRDFNTSQPYDFHNTSITAGCSLKKLEVFNVVGKLNNSYDFENVTGNDIMGIEPIKAILRNLNTVTKETLGLAYNLEDALDPEKTDDIDQELQDLVKGSADGTIKSLEEKGWTIKLI